MSRLFNKRIVILILPLIIAAVFVVPQVLPRAHALTGMVCLADALPTSTSPCPAVARTFNGPNTTPSTQLRIGVFIQGSDPTNGFSVSLKADHNFLKPAGVDITGTAIPGATTVVVECLSNVLIAGPSCGPQDDIDTLSFALAAGAGSVTTAPTTGLLFTAIYNITGTTSSSGIPVTFQSNATCNPSSIATNICVTISNGSGTPDHETSLTGTFNNATPPPYLTLTANPASQSSVAPFSGTSTITVKTNNGWPGLSPKKITFTVVATNGLTASISPTLCADASASTCTPTLSLSADTPGTYRATVFGKYSVVDSAGSSTLVAPVTVSVLLGDFDVSAKDTSVNFASGGTGTTTVTVTGTGGFTGNVALSQGLTSPTTGLTLTFAPSTVSLSPSTTTGTSTVTFSSSTQGTYHTQIDAVVGSGTPKSTALITVVVGPPATTPDFTIAANPTSVTGTTNTAATSQITIAPKNGFTGTVGLSVDNTACSISPLSATGGSGASTLSCTFTSANTFHVTVTGSSGSGTSTLSHTVTVDFTITGGGTPGVTISAQPTTVSVNTGVAGISAITITGTNGFAGTVALSQNGGTGCTLTPASVSLTATTTTGASVLSCTFTTAGTNTVTVSGTSGTTVIQPVPVTFNVGTVQPGFTLTASPTTLTCAPGQTKDVILTVAATGGFTGAVALTTTITPSTGLTGTLSSPSITGAGTATLTLTCTTVGAYTVNVAGTSGSLPVQNAMINVAVATTGTPDFGIAASPTSVQCTNSGTGTTGSSTITVSAMNGFAQTVSLDATTLPPGVTGTLSPISVMGSGTSTLSINCSGATAATYTISVRGHSAYLVHSVQVTVMVSQGQQAGSFTLTASPSSLACNTGAQAVSTVTVTPTGTFTENVALSTPSQTGISVSFSPTTVMGGTGSSTMTVTCTTIGSYNVVVTGTSASSEKIQTLTIPVTVSQVSQGSFTLAASPTSVTFVSGLSGTSTVTVAPIGTFTGSVALTTSVSSTGLTATLGQSTISGGSGSTVLTLHSSTAGTYTVTITGVSGATTKTATVTVVVTAQAQGGFTLTASPSSLRVLQGCTNATTLTLTSEGFTGTITLTSTVSPANAGLHADLSKLHVTLGVDKTNHLVLTISANQNATAGTYTVTVNAKSGSITRTVTVQVTVVHNASCTSDTDASQGCSDDDEAGEACGVTGDNSKGQSSQNICGSDQENGKNTCLQRNDTDQNSCKLNDNDEGHETGACSCPNVTIGTENENEGGGNNQQCNVNDQQVGQHMTSDKNCGAGGQLGGNDNEHGCKVSCKTGENNDNEGKTGDNGNKQTGSDNEKSNGGCKVNCGKSNDENGNHQAVKTGDNNEKGHVSDNNNASHGICANSNAESGPNIEKFQISDNRF